MRDVAPPPADFQLDDAKITPDMTNREKFITHTTNPACASCHAMFDGIGYAMEQYDAIGRFRTIDKTKTIDATGTLPLPSGTLKFTSYVDLIDQVAKLPETYAVRGLAVRRLRHRPRPRGHPRVRERRHRQGVRQLGLPAGRAGRGHRLLTQLRPAAELNGATPFHANRTPSLDARCCGGWARAA